MMRDTNQPAAEILIATATATIIEGLAVGLFLAAGFVWLAIYGTQVV